MRYRIEYAAGRGCNFVDSREDLLDWLKLLKDEQSAWKATAKTTGRSG